MTCHFPCVLQAIHCTLHNVCPPHGSEVWPEDSSDSFHELVGNADVVMTVKGGGEGQWLESKPLKVLLKLRATGEDVSTILVSQGTVIIYDY